MRSSTYGLLTALALLAACGSEQTDPSAPSNPSTGPVDTLPPVGGHDSAEATLRIYKNVKYPLVAITPQTDTLSAGASRQLYAVLTGSDGSKWTCAACTWTSSDTTKAKITADGVVKGVAAGTTTITARTKSSTTGSLTLKVLAATTTPTPVDSTPTDSTPTSGGTTPTVRPGYYVSASASSTGDGSYSKPWPLATALAQPSALRPGDTVWVRGGTYRGCYTSKLTGTSSAPIVVRAYPGERVTIDGVQCTSTQTLVINGSYAWYWGFEVTNSAPTKDAPGAIYDYGTETRLINLVVHDASGTGLGFWSAAAGGEVYGSVFYNNGSTDNLDHGIYTQNTSGTKRILDNIIFNNWTYGIHAYASSTGLKGYDIEGNTSFNNGSIGASGSSPNIMVGGSVAASQIVVSNNMTYASRNTAGNVWLGRSTQNQDVTIQNNYIAGGLAALRVWYWSSAKVSGNTLYGPSQMLNVAGSLGGYSVSGNTHYRDASSGSWINGSSSLTFAGFKSATGLSSTDTDPGIRPTGVKVFVRPNRYEPGRGNVTIYNWDKLASVSVDLSNVLKAGDAYEVRNVQNFYGTPVASGTYGGGSVSLSMAAVSPPRVLVGAATTPPTTGPEFQTFVVVKK